MIALPILGDLLFAVLCMALAYSITTFGRFIANLLPDVPLIGGAIKSAVIRYTDDAGNWLISATRFSYGRVHALLTDAAVVITGPLGLIISALEHHMALLSHLAGDVIPGVEALAKTFTLTQLAQEHAHVNSVESTLQTAISNEAAKVAHLLDTTLPNTVAQLQSDVVDTAQTTLDKAESFVNTALSAVQHDLLSRIASVASDLSILGGTIASAIPQEISTGIKSAVSAISAQFGPELATLSGEIDQLRTQLDQAITAGNAALQQEIAGAIDVVTSKLDTLRSTVALQQAQIGTVANDATVVIPAAIAGVAAEVASLTAEVENCAVTTCDGPNNIENVVNKLLSGLTTLGEIGFMVAAIKDPVQFADTFTPTLSGYVADATTLFNDLLSLAGV